MATSSEQETSERLGEGEPQESRGEQELRSEVDIATSSGRKDFSVLVELQELMKPMSCHHGQC